MLNDEEEKLYIHLKIKNYFNKPKILRLFKNKSNANFETIFNLKIFIRTIFQNLKSKFLNSLISYYELMN